jgi:hypothetical protein
MKKVSNWLTSNIGGLAILFLMAFIPLYPKLPLINVIRTFVYIRLEDFLVAAAIGVYGLWRIRKRSLPKSPLTWPILVFWGVGLVSAIYSMIFIGPKLMGYFPHLVLLHYLRRIEYMMLFFIAFDVVVRKKSLITAIIWTLAGTTVGIIAYGLGEKFYGWPAFLTMNEQFAKGIPLRLPPTARIPSTFGGHYDLAAFVVFTIPILTACAFAAKKIWQKVVFVLLSVGSLVMLFLTQSRTSFLVYIIAVSVMLFWYKKKWFIIPVIILSFFLLNFFNGASDRFYKTFRYNDVIVDLSTGKPVGTLASLDGNTAVVQQSQSPATESLPTGSEYISLPSSVSSSASTSSQVKTISYSSVNLETGSGEISTVSGSFLIQKALVYDISITTRLQGEWPLAMTAFKRNILLGSGYSTLSVASDGDYVRMLGETGILGTLAFFGILLTSYMMFFKRKETLTGYNQAFVIGVFGGLTGLIFNGILIDVFESSKVAFTLWLFLGAALALLTTAEFSFTAYMKLLWRAVTSNVAYVSYLFIAAIVLFGNSISNYFVADDFTWLRWAASTPVSGLLSYFTNAQGFFYRPIPKLWYFVLYAIFWLKPEGYHVMSYILLGLSAYFIYALMITSGVKRWMALVFSVLFTTLAIHHENVFWISGQSSLLSAVFLFGSITLYCVWRKPFSYVLSLLLLICSMFCYDGMIVAPVIYCLVLWIFVGKRHWTTLLPLIAIPFYWLVRYVSGAVPPSGDYGYKLSTLPFNFIGNSVGYIVSTFFGPRVIESWGTLREYLRVHRLMAAVGGAGLLVMLGVFVWKIRRFTKAYTVPSLWVICGFISLAAYLGLGNMSERYVFVASGFFIIAIGIAFSVWWKGAHVFWKVIAGLAIAGLMVWNIIEVNRLSGDWQKASTTSQNTLLALSKQFFPLRENISFFFVNTPIRFGRAWIFPTGLTDPLWHVFHFNSFGYTTTNVSSPSAAYAIPVKLGFDTKVFTFDNYVLKQVIRHEEPVVVK